MASQHASIAFWMGSWYLCSLVTLFMNKIILSDLGGDVHVLGLCQMVTTAVLGAAFVLILLAKLGLLSKLVPGGRGRVVVTDLFVYPIKSAGGVRLEANEQLTVIAFNTVRIQKGHHWKNTFRPDGGTKIPVLYQHSLMRFAFLRDDAKTLPPEPPNQQLALKRNVYAPAALFEYMRWPDDKSRSDWFDTLYNYD